MKNYITINLKEDSVFRSLRIITFRKELENVHLQDLGNTNIIIEKIDQINKKSNLNLVIINFENKSDIDPRLEDYLVNLNKKILIISKNKIEFNNYFINRSEEISGYFLTYFNNDIQYGSKYILKRALDVIISLLALFVFSPVFIFVSIYIYFLDGFPVVIKQERIGLHGQSFNMYKFRTMKLNSHEMRSDLQAQNEHDAEIFKMDDDPRILNGAKFIRNFSLDEFPQFINVLKGEMSIVGPRPLFDEDTQLFNENYMRRLNVLPGITGLLQINDRNTSEFSTWYKYDIEYIDNWTLFLDLKIILKTPIALLKGSAKRSLNCGSGGNRTHDLELKRLLLYQLSYRPVFHSSSRVKCSDVNINSSLNLSSKSIISSVVASFSSLLFRSLIKFSIVLYAFNKLSSRFFSLNYFWKFQTWLNYK